jgi:intracellular sulfur oxidation DsrE/DsrF family protein
MCCTAVDNSGPLDDVITLLAACCQTGAGVYFVVCCSSVTVIPLANISVCMNTECQYVPAPVGVVTKLRA